MKLKSVGAIILSGAIEMCIRDRITSVEEKDVDAMHEEHLAWWKNYWQKSYVDIDDDVLQRYYFGALYGLCLLYTSKSAFFQTQLIFFQTQP